MNTPRNKGGLGKMEIPLIGDISKTMSHDYGMLVCDADDDMDGVALRGVSFLPSEANHGQACERAHKSSAIACAK